MKNQEMLLVDNSRIFTWQKRKIYEFIAPSGERPMKVSFSPDGTRFVCVDFRGNAGTGNTRDLSVRKINKTLSFNNLTWWGKNSRLFWLENNLLYLYTIKDGYKKEYSFHRYGIWFEYFTGNSIVKYHVISACRTRKRTCLRWIRRILMWIRRIH